MALVNGWLFFREAVGQYEDNHWDLKNQRKDRVMLSRRHQETRLEKLQCLLCEGPHDIKDCTTIWEQAVEDRRKTIYKKLLCHGHPEGISKEHNAKSCSNRRKRKVYNGWSPIILHGIKIEKKRGSSEVAATSARWSKMCINQLCIKCDNYVVKR